MIYLTTDTHLGHKAIARYCDRPADFSEQILRNLKNVLKPEDTLIHLGDVAFSAEYMKKFLRIPCTKILVKGNHDTKSATQYMEMGFNLCCQELVVELHNVRIIFSHAPKYGHSYDINIHGHQHDLHLEDFSRLYLPLSIEQMGYQPLALDEKFLGVISSWSDRRHIPTLKEIQSLGQNHVKEGPQLVRDLYGTRSDSSDIEKDWKRAVERREIVYNVLMSNPEFYRITSLKAYESIIKDFMSGEIETSEALCNKLSALAEKTRCGVLKNFEVLPDKYYGGEEIGEH